MGVSPSALNARANPGVPTPVALTGFSWNAGNSAPLKAGAAKVKVASTPERSTGSSADGGRATEAGLCYPRAVALAPDGTLYIADGGNNRIRRIRWWPSQPDAAKAMADDLATKAGDSVSAWREVAELYMMAQSWDQALAAAQRSLALIPKDEEPGYTRAELLVARVCVAKRDDHGARRLLIRVLARTRDPGLLRQAGEALVDLYLLREERDQAIATLSDLRLRTDDPDLIRWVDQRLKEIAGD